ncbi:MAG: single-stranded-DNA-specific exonuclease RecJ [Candidatus Shapirobacteria bacterium]|jgi:single-stranded-DNA-specific exonuclease
MPQSKIILSSKQIIDGHTSRQELVTLLLKNRHVKKENLNDFLHPPVPSLFLSHDIGISQNNLTKAVARIKHAIKNQQNIIIYGDYDVDGITATAVLWQTLSKLGAKVIPFIPDREKDGYGFKANSLLRFEKEKNVIFDLLIAVDNGISAKKEFDKLLPKKIDLIITDHHVAPSELPDCYSLIHSVKVSGCGLSYLLAREFEPCADLGLVALGTVADCLPLVGINRSFVVHGLKAINTSPSFGIKKLVEISGVKQNIVSAFELGYLLGPRINAIGRLANPTDALRLLCSTNSQMASKYAHVLDGFNKDRQELQQEHMDSAEKHFLPSKDKLIFAANPDFHPGVIGLIAGRLTEKYYLPSIVISVGQDISKGSCRSIPELNIIEMLSKLSNIFLDYGGHTLAAGFTIRSSKIKTLQTKLTKIINKTLSGINLQPSIQVDAEMKLSAVKQENIKAITLLEPFGIGNSEPLFLFKGVTISEKQTIGSSNNHLKLKLDDPGTTKKENIATDAIAFKKGHLGKQLEIGNKVDIIASLSLNTWNNITTPQLIIKEIILDPKFKIYHSHRTEPYFSFLNNGQKTIEGRLKKEKYARIKPGDHIVVSNNEETDHLEVIVLKVTNYLSFREMLSKEPLKEILPNVDSIAKGIKIYQKFYTPKQEKEFGVVAIEVRLISTIAP